MSSDFIPFASMNFGTKDNSKCGICGLPEEGYWKNGKLQQDILCVDCNCVWKYNENKNGYEKTTEKEKKQILLMELYFKSNELFEIIEFLEEDYNDTTLTQEEHNKNRQLFDNAVEQLAKIHNQMDKLKKDLEKEKD